MFSATGDFYDTSRSYNTNIISRQWTFGDGQTLNTTQGGRFSQTYLSPGDFNVTLKITDDGGCSTTVTSQHAIVNRPKASFSSSGTNVQLNTSVYFYNNSNTYNSDITEFSWQFGDGGTSADYFPTHTYTSAGTYQVRLVAKSEVTGCRDTAHQQIVVKDFQVAFTYQQSFIFNGKCPPLLLQFNNQSVNYTNLKRDFGDGNVSEDVIHPSHLYTRPGEYTVTLTVKGYNGLTDIFKEIIRIKKPVVTLATDILHSCTAQSIRLTTTAPAGHTYSWDFRDGNLKNGDDSFAVHQYQHAGVYLPSIMITYEAGCTTAARLGDTIVIDSLRISLGDIPQRICAPKSQLFSPQIVNIAADRAQQPLLYHWDFGTGNKADTADVRDPGFNFQQAGNYVVSLQVKSAYGYEKKVQSEIRVLQGLAAQMVVPVQICEGATAEFSGSTLLPGQPAWKWIFHDGSTAAQQNPPSKIYNTPGSFPVKLVVDNGGCADTMTRILLVQPKPVIGLPFTGYILCRGAQVPITATGGGTYVWSPATGLDNTSNPAVIASPVSNTVYTIDATSTHGCSDSASVKITMIQPFNVEVRAVLPICLGNNATLMASGAHSYRWIQNTTSLNNTNIPDPIATPLISTIYMVVGQDANKCFADTANVLVNVLSLPTVDAGQTSTVMAGVAHQLQPTFSNDVVKWSRTPARYLNCTNCPAPVSLPAAPVIYKLTVANAAGCSVADTVSINLLCGESRVYIPTAFTPNNDGSNDLFAIKGDGIRLVRHFIIYDRYGHAILSAAILPCRTPEPPGMDFTKGCLFLQAPTFTSLKCRAMNKHLRGKAL